MHPLTLPRALLLLALTVACGDSTTPAPGQPADTNGAADAALDVDEGAVSDTPDEPPADPGDPPPDSEAMEVGEPDVGGDDDDTGAPDVAAPDDAGEVTPPLMLDCALFCEALTSVCAGQSPFASAQACAAACAALPLGTLSDSQGNTVGCRYTQLLLAQEQPGEAATHCADAGVLSAACGEPCAGYCAVAAAVCPGLYPTGAACASGCAEQWSLECSLAAHLDGSCEICLAPPPPADTCASAVVADALPFSFQGDTTGAADDLSYDGGECGGEFGGSGGANAPDHVIRYSADADGTVTITLQGASGYDPILYVLTDCSAPTASCLEKKDAVGLGAKEVITRAVTAGDTLFIVVDAADGQASEVGPYTVTITPASP